MLRVFAIRIINKRNPFSPDRMHLNYLLLNRNIKLNKILMIYFTLIIIPIAINQFFHNSQTLIILTYISLYLIFVLSLKKKFFS